MRDRLWTFVFIKDKKVVACQTQTTWPSPVAHMPVQYALKCLPRRPYGVWMPLQSIEFTMLYIRVFHLTEIIDKSEHMTAYYEYHHLERPDKLMSDVERRLDPNRFPK